MPPGPGDGAGQDPARIVGTAFPTAPRRRNRGLVPHVATSNASTGIRVTASTPWPGRAMAARGFHRATRPEGAPSPSCWSTFDSRRPARRIMAAPALPWRRRATGPSTSERGHRPVPPGTGVNADGAVRAPASPWARSAGRPPARAARRPAASPPDGHRHRPLEREKPAPCPLPRKPPPGRRPKRLDTVRAKVRPLVQRTLAPTARTPDNRSSSGREPDQPATRSNTSETDEHEPFAPQYLPQT